MKRLTPEEVKALEQPKTPEGKTVGANDLEGTVETPTSAPSAPLQMRIQLKDIHKNSNDEPEPIEAPVTEEPKYEQAL